MKRTGRGARAWPWCPRRRRGSHVAAQQRQRQRQSGDGCRGARFTLKVPAASAAPVPPAQTSARAVPPRPRALLHDRRLLASSCSAHGTSASAVRRARLSARCPRPPRRSRPRVRRAAAHPCAAASAAPRRPHRDRGRRRWIDSDDLRDRLGPCRRALRAERPSRASVLVVVTVELADHLTARIGTAHGARPVRSARAVALRACVQVGR